MHANGRNGQAAMLGKTGVVLQNIDPEGKIKYAAARIGKAMAKLRKANRQVNVARYPPTAGISVPNPILMVKTNETA